jgi:hypothetical protein
MIDILFFGYLAGWVLTTVGLALSVDRMQDPRSPQLRPLPLAVVAGALWPLLILGAVEYATVAAAAALSHGGNSALTVKL